MTDILTDTNKFAAKCVTQSQHYPQDVQSICVTTLCHSTYIQNSWEYEHIRIEYRITGMNDDEFYVVTHCSKADAALIFSAETQTRISSIYSFFPNYTPCLESSFTFSFIMILCVIHILFPTLFYYSHYIYIYICCIFIQ